MEKVNSCGHEMERTRFSLNLATTDFKSLQNRNYEVVSIALEQGNREMTERIDFRRQIYAGFVENRAHLPINH
jgi:hypothetical protein